MHLSSPLLKIYLLSTIILSSVFSFASMSIKINPSGLDSQQYLVAKNRIELIYKKLPKKMTDLNLSVEIKFSENLKNLKTHTAGVYKGNGFIELNPYLFDSAKNNSELLPLFDNTVVHELAHAYDMANVHTDEENKMINYCSSFRMNSSEGGFTAPSICALYKDTNTSASSNYAFLNLAGWYQTGIDGQRQSESFFKHRTIDSYELKNSAENFAVNMEGFLLDPQFSQRKPLLYKFLSKNLNHIPFPEATAEGKYFYVDSNQQDPSQFLKEINLDKVYQIHYLFASKGKEAMSKWGHAMYRIVMCAPQRQTVGPDCLKDLRHHIVLSFRALVNTTTLNKMDGITGKYPSRLFFLPISQVVDEYTKTELRDLISYPLNLSKEEMSDFVKRSLEIHWGYDGKYYFLTNNCATESLNLLKSVTPSNTDLASTLISTPLGLYEKLKEFKYLNDHEQENQKQAIESGFLFPSFVNYYNTAFDNLKQFPEMKFSHFDEYLIQSAEIRSQIFQSVMQQVPINQKSKIVSSFILLESLQERRLIQNIQNRVTETYIKNKNAETEVIAQKNISAAQVFSNPAVLLKKIDGYGLPQDSEEKSLRPNLEKIAKDYIQNSSQVGSAIKSAITPDEQQKLDELKQNFKLFYARFYK